MLTYNITTTVLSWPLLSHHYLWMSDGHVVWSAATNHNVHSTQVPKLALDPHSYNTPFPLHERQKLPVLSTTWHQLVALSSSLRLLTQLCGQTLSHNSCLVESNKIWWCTNKQHECIKKKVASPDIKYNAPDIMPSYTVRVQHIHLRRSNARQSAIWGILAARAKG